MKGSKIFTVMVVGDNPEELMDKYDMNLIVPKYVKYRYLDADKMKKNAIKILNEIIKNPQKFQLNDYNKEYLKDRVKELTDMTTFEYYSSVTNGLYYDENGDALSDRNPNGKWVTYNIGKNLSLPLILKDGSEVYQSTMCEIDWNKMHMVNTELYDRVWELMVDGDKIKNDTDQQIYNNMRGRESYFSSFKNKDEYVAHNCAYWNYAFLDENGWVDLDDSNKSTIDWVINYFEKFIKRLNPNDKITIFECTKNKNQ